MDAGDGQRIYDPHAIERRWQEIWERERTWEVPNPGEPGFDDSKPKSYVLEMLPYPSGEPHVGHLKNYSIGDALAHFRRRNGHQVIHPMGYDAFGLPAENNAIKTGVHPREATEASIEAYREQFRAWGVSIDWSREISSHWPSYYRWTQWLFLRFYERGLAYRAEAPVQWCPVDQTVLANEQVIDGHCERCGSLVESRDLEQWFFKITEYADRLLADFDLLESWPEHVVTMQRNWIGRSEGAEVTFRCEELGIDFPVFTTRPDTLFGATFFVLAPEHPDVERLAAGTGHEDEVRAYIDAAARESVEERGDEGREKTGVPLGRTVTNPVNGERIPMFVADYVLMEYGTGALMAVPAHDARDHEFARTFGIEIREVVAGGEDVQAEPYVGDGPLVASGPFDGKDNREAYAEIVEWLSAEGKGGAAVNYRLRDWLLSRQRYWGCPIPIVYCERDGMVAVPDEQLPVELPEVEDYAPKGQSPLAAVADWVNTECPKCGGPARRETDTMDTFVDSSWYFLRYLDPHNEELPFEPASRRLLDAGRQLHRRGRARDPPPDVRALLHQGARGHGDARGPGAVREPLHPGDDHHGRREDVLVEGQHGERGRHGRALRRRHRAHLRLLPRPAGARRRLDRPRGSRACTASWSASGGSRARSPSAPTPPPAAGRPPATARRASSSARPTGRSTRSPTTSSASFQLHTAIAAVMELVNDAYRLKDVALRRPRRATRRCASPPRPPPR